MLDKIIAFSLRNRPSIIAAALVLMAAGMYCAYHAEVDVFPDLNAPTVVVMTEAEGMATEEVEQLITFPIETALNGATGVRRVRSSSTTGFSVVWVEFDWGTDIYLDRQIVSEKLATVQETLPEKSGIPTLGPQSSILGEVLIAGLTSDSLSMLDLRTIADRTIRPRLLSIGGVAQVSVIGGDVKEYRILLDDGKMRHYGVKLAEVLAAVRGMNENEGGGIIYEFGNEYIIRGISSTTDTEAMERSLVAVKNGSPVCLGDIADIRVEGHLPKLGMASEKGKPAVLLTITKQPATSTLELTDKLLSAIDELQTGLGAKVNISTDSFRQSRFIDNSIDNVRNSLLEGGIFVVFVLILFLANLRTTVISLVTIPLSLLITFIVLDLMDLGINTMSLGGMAIAIGSLVDDAIVDVENVVKHLRQNHKLPANERKKTLQVVFEASREVRMPILNSTLIIVASFVPLFFLSGMEGRMLIPLGIAFIVSLFASTVVALTLTPVLSSYLLGGKTGEKQVKEARLSVMLQTVYQKALAWALDHKTYVISVTAVLFIIAIGCCFTLGRSFLPPFNEGSLTINISCMPGISLEESDKIGRQAEELLLEIPEIYTVVRKTGRAELDEHALGANVSEIEAPFNTDGRSHAEIIQDVRKKLSAIQGANIEIGQPISHRIDAMLSGTQAGIAIKLFGNDIGEMYALANEIKAKIANVEGIADLNVEQQVGRPEIRITPNRGLLALHGISMSAFNEFINVTMAGEKVSQVYQDAQTYDLVVSNKRSGMFTIEELEDLPVDDGYGGTVPLGEIAEISSTSGPNTINRENVKRKIVISANAAGRDLGSIVEDIREIIDAGVRLPEGYHIEYGGQFESERNATRTLVPASLLSILVIFLLLYMEFKDPLQSAVVLLNLPLALIGGVFAIVLTTGEFSIPAIIGFISLFGIATRNGMLLINRYNLLRSQGYGLKESIMAGSADRLNPILMTALSSALALVPLALRSDMPGNEIQSPMAKVILGGLLTSTFLNGFIVPVFYEIIHRKEVDSD